MFDTDVVYFQTKTEVNNFGTVKQTWALSGASVTCDVQDISRERVLKDYGFADSTEYLQVYDRSLSANWVELDQVVFDSKQYLVRVVKNWSKLGSSNHKYIVLSAVV